ncbi:LPS export ABC transporter permease LptF [Methylophaga sp. OBS1]|uniref:LPS export ABC transporter permease LptF n=1 Tax=Methylophaga sp. OBS1 TaxID=2991933 RepID=UPI00225142DA|nr:LPS export ABC transporter permease LptF [Methylophaga sp. OBS1]MCX4190974.1 LPS export ABC transporter permease LptF [Methylophaga sp. OBS1]MCX4192080.1 LPS export ABC transporter permease LptF [Methylophaga sp. OBS1]
MLNVPHPISSWLTIIDRYLLREFVINLVAVTGVLWLIYISTRFARYLADAAVGNMPADVIFSLLGLSSLGALSILLPIGAFLAVMLSLGRMSSDNELTVMSACGISNLRIMRNVLLFAGTIAVIVAVLSLFVVPGVLSERYELQEKAKISANTTGLIAGSFKESEGGDWTFYSQGLSANKQFMENVFIEIDREDKPLIFRSETGHFEIDSQTGDKFLVLEEGYRYEGRAGDQDFTIAQFGSHSLLIEKGQEGEVRERHKAMATSDLLARGEPRDLAEVQWRTAAALMTLLLCLLAIPLANAGPRQGRYAGFVPAVLIYIIYSNLLGVNRAWVAKGDIPVWLGGVWVHVLMLVVLLLLLNRQTLRRFLSRYQQKQSS